jgi:hypothetical protein
VARLLCGSNLFGCQILGKNHRAERWKPPSVSGLAEFVNTKYQSELYLKSKNLVFNYFSKFMLKQENNEKIYVKMVQYLAFFAKRKSHRQIISTWKVAF